MISRPVMQSIGVALPLLLTTLSLACAETRTVASKVTMGSSMGTVSVKQKEFTYAFGVTKGIRLLSEGCGVRMGSESYPCIVKFRETKGSIIEFLSAKLPTFAGKKIDLAGSVFDTILCPTQQALENEAPSCKEVNSQEIYIEKANAQSALIIIDGDRLFAKSQRVIINCKGSRLSLRSFLTNDLPPGIKSCR